MLQRHGRKILLSCSACVFIVIVVLAYVTFRIASAPPSARRFDTLLTLAYGPPHFLLHSTAKYSEVDIPFIQKDSHINIQSIWAGRPTACILDTGAAATTWPSSLQLPGNRVVKQVEAMGAANLGAEGNIVILSSIRLGNYEVKNISTFENSDRIGKQPIFPMPIIGNSAFSDVVLTIDYHRREIILRSKDYDIRRQAHDATQLLDILWNDGEPTVKGFLASHPAYFLIDTGCNSLIISSDFDRKFLTHFSHKPKQIEVHVFGGLGKAQQLLHISGKIGKTVFQVAPPGVEDLPRGLDAAIGAGFLQHFRVTIDYGRSKLLLEPN